MDSLSKVKGIGPKTELLLNKIGIYNIDDLVTHYPYRYDVLRRSDLREITDPEKKIVVDRRAGSAEVLAVCNRRNAPCRGAGIGPVLGRTILGLKSQSRRGGHCAASPTGMQDRFGKDSPGGRRLPAGKFRHGRFPEKA